MNKYHDKFTGKPVDKPSDLLPENNGETCDECGTELIDRCYRCGAPVCCPKCCFELTVTGRSND
jgi:hypothetical protein